MLDDATKGQLKAYLDRLVDPIVFKFAGDDSAASGQILDLLKDTASLSEKITLETASSDEALRRPSFTISRAGTSMSIRFAALPMGHEFSSFILAMLQASGYPSKTDEALLKRAAALKGPLNFEVFMSLSCHNCPDVVQALNLMAVINPAVSVTVVDGALFQDEAKERRVMAVPTVFLNGEEFMTGRHELAEIVAKLDDGYAAAAAAAISEKAPFDVLVLGAGPAGATAAIYAARKGLRTGMVAERPGGQVNETADIENFTSICKTDGPKLGAAMMEHVKSYGVDIMAPELVKAAVREGDQWVVTLENGGELRTKALIAATGARWRTLNVPGENKLRGKGVCFCPHCDGPLFKGKDVVVIGGGNSGVEAAIDLAGICRSVTLLQRGGALTADEVLQKRLSTIGNAKVILNTAVTELAGDASLEAVCYTDKATGEAKRIPASGVFIQVGLVPNTEWAADAVTRNRWGEIEIDAHGAASAPGFFAAGDCTNVPYKQVIVAMGEGAKASLGAFDWMIRQ